MSTSGAHTLDHWADLSASLRRYARALTGSADAGDDLTQQTLARLLARSPGQAPHLGYAYSAMTRVWLDEQRSLRRRSARLAAIAAGFLGTVGVRAPANPGPNAHDARQVGLRHALDRLPPRRRAVLVLKAVEGLQYQQIAAALGCSVATVRTELHEARRTLRAIAASAGTPQEDQP